MANRLDYFFRQKVTEAELDEGFDKMEQGQLDIMGDQLLIGIFSGGEVSEHAGTPDLTVDIAGPCLGRDKNGNRLFFSPLQNLNMALDENSVTTAVGTPGNEKTLSIFLAFDRALSDSRLDGNSIPVFFQRAESFKLNVVQSVEAAIGASVPPALRVDEVLLADVTLINAQTQILNADIDTARREDVFVLTGTPFAVSKGQVKDALQQMLDNLNSISTGGASTIGYAGGPAWADATTNPATNVELQLDKIITDLASGTGGTAKISGAASANPNPVLTSTTLAAQLTELESEVVDGGNKHGLVWIPIEIADAITNGVWTHVINTLAADYWNFTGAVSADQVIIPFVLRVGDTLDEIFIGYETTGGTDELDFVVEKYDSGGGGFTRSVIGSSLNQGGGGLGVRLAGQVAAIAHLADDKADRYRLTCEPKGAGSATRRIYGAAMRVSRKTA